MGDCSFSFTTTKAAFVEAECCGGKIPQGGSTGEASPVDTPPANLLANSLMTTSGRSWGWRLGIASFLAMGGAIAICGNCVHAQIAPDSTLGTESSVVTSNIDGLPTERIDGGATRGANLFHSFEKFSVPTGSAAYFNNAPDIQNIISRVTGSSISNIDGLIRANGTANLFLLNPNGIIFGPNASLNIGGSFVASTASAINFADDTQFSATAHSKTPLLRVSIPIGLQYGGTAGSILNQSQATDSSGEAVGLAVAPGKTLALVGGDVRLDGGNLQAPGGRVELGGLAGSGTIEMNVDSDSLLVSFPEGVARADVYLTQSGSNTARVNVAASNGGSIAITARNIDIAGGSLLRGGLETDLGFPGAEAGDIELRAQGTINVADGFISNYVRSGAVGKGGNIDIQAGSLSVTKGAQLLASTFGQGDAGSVNIFARDTVSFDGVGSDRASSAVFSTVESKAVGNGGGINITTGSLSVTNGALLAASTRGQGDAGSVNIFARDTVSFNGGDVFSTVAREAVGNGGGINITTGSLALTNDATLTASTFGQGNAGSVNIFARDTVSFNGGDVFSSVAPGAVGKGGDIDIQAGSLSVTDGAQLLSRTRGQGDAGSVNIFARDTVSFDGVSSNVFSSAAFSTVDPGAVGKGGDINITTGSLSVTNGALLAASTRGQGDAGSVNIFAHNTVSFDGVGSNGFPSAAASTVEPGAVGNSVGINITTGSLSVMNGAQLSASTSAQGNGGNITINANTLEAVNGGQVLTTSRSSGKAGNINVNIADSVTLSGSDINYFARPVPAPEYSQVVVSGAGPASGLFASTSSSSTAQGGDLRITTGQLIVRDEAEVNVSSEGSGNAGNLEIASRDLLLDNRGVLRATTLSGEGGNITLLKQDLILMRRNSEISTSAGGTGNGGNITIDTDFIVAVPEENSDIIANANQGAGGFIEITAQGVFGLKRSEQLTPLSDITAFSQQNPELNGVVEINTPDIDPSRGLVNLPAELVDASNSFATGCWGGVRQGESKFVVTGRGGLPPNPSEALSGDAIQVDWVTLNPRVQNRSSPPVSTNPTAPEQAPIVEAQGWVINNKGEVVLTATAPTPTPHIPWMTPVSCHTPETSS